RRCQERNAAARTGPIVARVGTRSEPHSNVARRAPAKDGAGGIRDGSDDAGAAEPRGGNSPFRSGQKGPVTAEPGLTRKLNGKSADGRATSCDSTSEDGFSPIS